MAKRRSALAQARSYAYTFGKVAGDVRAVQTGTVGRRAYNRGLGRLLGRLFK